MENNSLRLIFDCRLEDISLSREMRERERMERERLDRERLERERERHFSNSSYNSSK